MSEKLLLGVRCKLSNKRLLIPSTQCNADMFETSEVKTFDNGTLYGNNHGIIISKDDCHEILKSKFGNGVDYKLVTFKLTPIFETLGFMGAYFRLKTTTFLNGRNENLHFFIKAVPHSEAQRKILAQTKSFAKESKFYGSVVKSMNKYGIHIINECITRCYKVQDNEFMVMEDLSYQGYKTLSRTTPFTFQQLSITLRKLARFHASSLLLEETISKSTQSNYRLNKEFVDVLEEAIILQDENHEGARVVLQGLKCRDHIIDKLCTWKTDEEKADLKARTKLLDKLYFQRVQSSDQFRNVICHGDLWASNILFKSGDCCFIDFQRTRYLPPAHDLLLVLYLTTNRRLRSKHMRDLIAIYYEELQQTLEKFGSDSGEIYPFQTFMASIEYMKPQVVCMSILQLQFIGAAPEDIQPYITDEKISEEVFVRDRRGFIDAMCERSGTYKSRLCEALLDLEEICDSLF